ncbi:hypothetical protein FACS1894156_2120 [Bacteroidia bacterium]|nr:hypothetical protein FACS1894156_2120 [Bacteroidia bacterium]
MKNILKYSTMLVLAVILLASCSDKATEGLSRITYYCDLELEGPTEILLAKGTAFDEPGYKASEGDNDVTDAVTVTPLDVNTPGVYTLTYSVKNQDGFAKTATRKVYVYDDAASPIESGNYYVATSSSRTAKGVAAGSPATEFRTQPSLVIIQTAPGRFYVSDLFGGYYNVGRGYGTGYAISGILAFNGTNFSRVSSATTPWGDTFGDVRGTYNAGTKTLSLQVDYTANYTFHLNIVKE